MNDETKLEQDVRRWINDYLEEHRESQNELARKTGINQAMISRFLTGQRDMNITTLGRLLPVLGAAITRKRGRPKKRSLT